MNSGWILIIVLLFCGCFRTAAPKSDAPPIQNPSPNSEDKIAGLVKVKQSVAPFFKLMGKPRNTDWLATFKEPGQTFEEYIKSNPAPPTFAGKTIYIQPIGKFSAKQRAVLALTAAYMKAFYNLPIELKPELELANVPKEFTRTNAYTRRTQIETTYFLQRRLPEILPADAAALICLTSFDLYPKDGWSFVFGEASLQNRVGVWSLSRLGDPDKSRNDYRLFLARTLKIAMHETGHLFSMRHCTKYECLMSGTNNLDETDRRPADVCPECMAKIAWAMNYNPAERYKNLAKFWAEQGQLKLSDEFNEKAKAVERIQN